MLRIAIVKLVNIVNLTFIIIFTILIGIVFFVSNLNYFFAQNISTMTTKKFDKRLVMSGSLSKLGSLKQYKVENYSVSWESQINQISFLDDELFNFLADKNTNGIDFLSNQIYLVESKITSKEAMSYKKTIYNQLSNLSKAMEYGDIKLDGKKLNFVGNFKLYLGDIKVIGSDKVQTDPNPIEMGQIILRMTDKDKVTTNQLIKSLVIHQFENENAMNIAIDNSKEIDFVLIDTANQRISGYYQATLFKYLDIILYIILFIFGTVGVVVFCKSWQKQAKYRFLYIATGASTDQIAKIYIVFYGFLLISSAIFGILLTKIALQLSLDFWTTNIFDEALVLGNNYNFEAVSFFAPNLFLVIIWVFLVIFSTLIFYAKSNN